MRKERSWEAKGDCIYSLAPFSIGCTYHISIKKIVIKTKIKIVLYLAEGVAFQQSFFLLFPLQHWKISEESP